MAKKSKKKTSTDTAETSTSTTALTATAPIESDPELKKVDAAFEAGNYAMVRAIAASSTSPPVKEYAERLMPKIEVEKAQLLPGVAAILVLLIVAAIVLVGCASDPEVKKRPILHPPDEYSESKLGEIEEKVEKDTRASASKELDCPEDQIVIQCTQKDNHGGCVALQAKGCNKTLEYSFGNHD